MAEDQPDSAAGTGGTHSGGGAQSPTNAEHGTAVSAGEAAATSSNSSSSASEAFAAGRAERDGSRTESDPAGGGPGETATVEHPQAARTEVMNAPSEAPTTVAPAPEPPPQQAAARPARSGPSVVGTVLRRLLGLLATLVTIVGVLAAAVLVLFIVLRIVAVNPENGVAQAVTAVADRLVGAFRDLFLIPDPVVGLVVNYGLAAVVWIIAAVIVARILRAVGRVIP